MIAGGTGITPMLQVIGALLKNHSKDTVKCWLIFANQTEEDILLRKELESIINHPNISFKLHYTLDRPPTDGSWKYSSGFINVNMCKDHLPSSSSENCMIFMCGPPPMIKFACEPALKELGYSEEQLYTF